ncbi:ROK family transcriptional regulator [Inquilinus limosus]|uniref:Transcriptional regulator n=1 Tax=Inquilinus limosus MP06 TaxID=1398085 RepID=A0A0A0D8J1_9PROT|nr:ROK family transcriptional regulator [Inquilinus limosus]KGM34163.1 transcriptional regulator [Inquilinus limosus MP06]
MANPSKRSLLKAVADHGPLSRSELAILAGLSKAAITGLSRELIQDGALEESEIASAPSRQGRPSILLRLNPTHGYFIGASIVEEPVALVLADLQGAVLAQRTAPWSNDPQAIAATIREAIPHLLAEAGVPAERLRGIGVALSGLVSHDQDRCLHSTNLGWIDLPVAAVVGQATGVPAFLENDANAVATGERLYGLARDYRTFTTVTFGDSIGCAHYVDGALYRGHGGGAGEIAHCTIEPGGLPCRCGKRGCLDTVAPRQAILAQARARGLGASTMAEVEALAAQGHADAIAILHRAGAALGLAIAHVIQVNDPEFVLIVDVEGAMGALFRTVTRQAIEANVLPRLAASTTIRFHEATRDLWARGAASIAAQKFLTRAEEG